MAMVMSAGYNRPNVEENIDLLKMAPRVDAVDKMGIYSDEFNAGQPGFLLIDSDLYADPDPIPEAGVVKDPFSNLKGIEQLETKCNSVDNTTACFHCFLNESNRA